LVVAEKSGGVREEYNLRGRQCREALAIVARAGGSGEDATYKGLLAGSTADALLATARDVLTGAHEARFRHVVSEATRVEEAREAMLASDLQRFGRLMSESHASLREDFEVSCEALDDLVRIAVDSGAVGARLTGAGFGGCAVALCHEADVESVMRGLLEAFYRPRGAGANPVIVAAPSAGASVSQL
jgi:galactokinase